jgi:hypothetical protein
MLHARAALCVLCGLLTATAACLAPAPAAERATDAARELNVAARFGRMDIALSRTTGSARENFMRRRGEWGGEIRVVDVELAGMSMPDSEHAIFEVDYAWMRMSEGTLRTTRVAQHWHDTKGSWQLERERRAAGDLGLFGEAVEVVQKPPRDVQFATKIIPANEAAAD